MCRRLILETLALSGLIVATAFTAVEAQGRRSSRPASSGAEVQQREPSRPASSAAGVQRREPSRPASSAAGAQQREPSRPPSSAAGAQQREPSRQPSSAAGAQRREPSRPPSSVVRAQRHGYPRFVPHAYGRRYYGGQYLYPWGFYSPWYYPSYPYYHGGYMVSSVRIQAEPKNAEVYIDGRFAGVVDEFDGFFQALRVEPGGHDLRLYLEGYRSVSQRVYVGPGESFKWRTMMERLAPGEANEPRPLPPPDPQFEQEPAGQTQGLIPGERLPDREEPDYAMPSNFGQIVIRVQPADAEVLIDDEPWRTPDGTERLVVHLRPGAHRVEIRKEGHDPFVTSVDVKKGETAILNVSLAKLD